MSRPAGDVVVVTGAAGFLGVKVVELLNTRGLNIQEIRGFDIVSQCPSYFVQNADSGNLRYHQGDICDYDQVKAVVTGATVVIHTAAIVDVNQPQETLMNAVNVGGTENIIRACVECNVTSLVYTSTADVVLGWSDNHNLNEATPAPGDRVSDYLFGLYAFTKMKAERKVLQANGTKCASGRPLVTCALRPSVMYGEGDKVFVPKVIESAKSHSGCLPRMGGKNATFHMCYVGNAAWAHVVATERMQTSPNLIGGKAFFIGDNTPENTFLDSVEPFLSSTGCKLLSFSIPYSILLFFAILLELIAWILKPFCSVSVTLKRASIFSLCKGVTFSWKKAKKELSYQPIFSYKESKTNTVRNLVERFVSRT